MSKLPVTFEAQYIAQTVGPAIAKGLSEIVETRPADPVEYLAFYLHKYVQNRNQQKKDQENEALVNKLRKEKELEEKRQEEMKKEAEALRIYEEEQKKEREAEERRKRELEELAKRKEAVANLDPALPSLAEEEENQLVEFGETKLHQLAAVAGSNLLPLLKDNCNLAARNSHSKTPRDIAVELNLVENIKQIDEYICDLVDQEDYKHLTDLAVLGFDHLNTIIEAKFGNADQMREKGLHNQVEQIYTAIPQVLEKIAEIKKNIEAKDLASLQVNLDKKWLAYYRNIDGKSPLHTAIEKGFFEIALFLLEKAPLLSKLNDCAEKYPIDYLKKINNSTLDPHDAALYEQLSQKLN